VQVDLAPEIAPPDAECRIEQHKQIVVRRVDHRQRLGARRYAPSKNFIDNQGPNHKTSFATPPLHASLPHHSVASLSCFGSLSRTL
jgi:hypothetical protein